MDQGTGRREGGQRLVAAGYSAALTLLIVGPLLGPGYLLVRDAVSTPRSYLTDSALGLGDAAPRAVPQDALLATVSMVADGGLVVKAILLAALWAAGYGSAVLVRTLLARTTLTGGAAAVPLAAQLVAVTVALWNPYVAERLLQGHWSLLAGYAALPWTAWAAYRIRTTSATRASSAGRWAALAVCLAAAGLTPTGALLAGFVAVVTIGLRRIPAAVVLTVIASAPWLAASALSGAGADPSDPAGASAFAARAEPGLGTLGSLAGLGGIWNADAVPASRTTVLAVVGTLALLAVVATGVRAVATARFASPATAGPGTAGSIPGENNEPARGEKAPGTAGFIGSANSEPTQREKAPGTAESVTSENSEAPGHPAEPHEGPTRAAQEDSARMTRQDPARAVRRALLWTAVGAVVLPALAATGWGVAVMAWLIADVPGAGLLRDTQKYVALAVPGYALCAAAGCLVLTAAWQRRAEVGPALVATAFVAVLVVPLLDLAWGVGGQVRPVRYPAGWERIAAEVRDAGEPRGAADVAVLPGGMFRKFPYSGSAPVLDPAPRMLSADVLQTGELRVRGRTVSGEGTRAGEVEELLLGGGAPAELAERGVGWVLVERTTPGPLGESARTLAGLEQVYADADLALYRVPDPADGSRPAETVAAQHYSATSAQRWASGLAHGVWAGMLLGGLFAAAGLRWLRQPGNRRQSP
ncbi:hypothetical protein [Nocardia higoensis]|uniref:hypothetical protein n=1 Tax=Nocardia higoensis TaxID=228599 RepID=UPI000314E728|nr:hypothetical protein [Nocardia higoensis]